MPADNASTTTKALLSPLCLRNPTVTDAAQISNLVRESDALDANSRYAYLLLCDHFADTCLVASAGELVYGFVSAYRPPNRPGTIFVWQIGIAAAVRRRGLAKQLLHQLVALPACREVRYLEATVTPSNAASRRLFQSFAADLDVPCRIERCFTAEMFGCGKHEEEELFRIGPFANSIQEVQPI